MESRQAHSEFHKVVDHTHVCLYIIGMLLEFEHV